MRYTTILAMSLFASGHAAEGLRIQYNPFDNAQFITPIGSKPILVKRRDGNWDAHYDGKKEILDSTRPIVIAGNGNRVHTSKSDVHVQVEAEREVVVVVEDTRTPVPEHVPSGVEVDCGPMQERLDRIRRLAREARHGVTRSLEHRQKKSEK